MTDPLRARHLIVLGSGIAVTVATAAVLLVVALPPVANLFADIFLFITRLLRGK